VSRKQVAETLKDAVKKGWSVSQTSKGHHKLRHAQSDRTVFTSGTPSDFRSVLNFKAELQRALKPLDTPVETNAEIQTPKIQKHKPASRQESYPFVMPTRPKTPNELRLDDDLAEARAAWWGSLPERALPKAWGLAILRLRSEGKGWDLVTLMKDRVRSDEDFRTSVVERWLETSATAIEALRVGLRAGFTLAPKTIVPVRRGVVQMTPRHEVTVIPFEGPDPAIRQLVAERERAEASGRRVAELETMLAAANAAAQDTVLAERQRRLYAEHARDEAHTALAAEKEARRAAERDLRDAQRRLGEIPAKATVPAPRVLRASAPAPVKAPVALPSMAASILAGRTAAGLSQRALGERLGVSGNTIRDWESGKFQPSPERRALIESVLNALPVEVAPPKAAPKPMGKSIKERRIAAGLSQREFAKRVGVVGSNVCHWESDQWQPSPSRRADIERVLSEAQVSAPTLAARRLWTGGENIKARREAAGLSQIALGKLVGVSGPSISNWEHGVFEPAMEIQSKLGAILGLRFAVNKPVTKAPKAASPAPKAVNWWSKKHVPGAHA
jgi:transcriptional regulator with XRE-family HTH domain